MEEVGPATRPSKRIGDKGPGPDQPPSPRGVDGLKLLLDFLGRRRPSTAGDLVRRRTPLADLPPMDFEPMAFQPPPPSLKRTDREKLLKAMEKSIAEEFRKRLSRGEAPAAGVDMKNLFGPSPLPTLRLETQAPPSEETFSEKLVRHLQTPQPREETFTEKLVRHLQTPPPREETFSEKLVRHLQTPPPREETFSEKLERYLNEPPDFRTEGEKRRDVRQAEARREPAKREPSAMDKLLAHLEAERSRAAQIPESVPLGEGASYEQEPPKLPERLLKVPKSVSELPDIEGRLFERIKETDNPLKLAREILLASPLDEYLEAGKKADEFTDRMIREGIITEAKRDGIYNALHHFLAAYTITREYGNPRLTSELGVLNELIISPITGWWNRRTKEEIAIDTEIDYYHNQLGIEEAVRHAGKDVLLSELVRRLAKEGKFRY